MSLGINVTIIISLLQRQNDNNESTFTSEMKIIEN